MNKRTKNSKIYKSSKRKVDKFMKSLEISVDHFDSDSDFDSDGQDLILNGCLDDNDF